MKHKRMKKFKAWAVVGKRTGEVDSVRTSKRDALYRCNQNFRAVDGRVARTITREYDEIEKARDAVVEAAMRFESRMSGEWLSQDETIELCAAVCKLKEVQQ